MISNVYRSGFRKDSGALHAFDLQWGLWDLGLAGTFVVTFDWVEMRFEIYLSKI